MENKSYITYEPPKQKFVQVSNNVVDKYAADIVGIYCKIVRISQGKTLRMGYISKALNVSDKKLRKAIVFLEDEGYIVRKPVKNERGFFIGWNYVLYAEPVDEKERSHAGKKSKIEDDGLYQKRTSPITDKMENGKENNNIAISNKDIPYIYTEKPYYNEEKKSTNVDKKENDEFTLYMRQHYPYIMKMDKPLTQAQATKLKEEYGEEAVLEIFEAMNNYKPLSKYRDAYMVALKWLKRRNIPNIKPQPQQKED